MKVSKQQLNAIIQEELSRVLQEGELTEQQIQELLPGLKNIGRRGLEKAKEAGLSIKDLYKAGEEQAAKEKAAKKAAKDASKQKVPTRTVSDPNITRFKAGSTLATPAAPTSKTASSPTTQVKPQSTKPTIPMLPPIEDRTGELTPTSATGELATIGGQKSSTGGSDVGQFPTVTRPRIGDPSTTSSTSTLTTQPAAQTSTSDAGKKQIPAPAQFGVNDIKLLPQYADVKTSLMKLTNSINQLKLDDSEIVGNILIKNLQGKLELVPPNHPIAKRTFLAAARKLREGNVPEPIDFGDLDQKVVPEPVELPPQLSNPPEVKTTKGTLSSVHKQRSLKGKVEDLKNQAMQAFDSGNIELYDMLAKQISDLEHGKLTESKKQTSYNTLYESWKKHTGRW